MKDDRQCTFPFFERRDRPDSPPWERFDFFVRREPRPAFVPSNPVYVHPEYVEPAPEAELELEDLG